MPSRAARIKNAYTAHQMYEFYLRDNPEGSYDYIKREDYVELVNEYCKYLSECIVDNGGIVKLPYNKGTLGVYKWLSRSKNPKRTPIDWVKSKELGKRVYLTNSHSNGYLYRFMWNKGMRYKTLLSFYKFRPARELARRLAYIVKTKQNDYFLG